MAHQYFIKRGKKINGPFTVKKLQALKKAKKLKAGDEISQSEEGPWESISASYKVKQSSEQPNPSPAKPSPKTVACEDCGGVVSRRAQSCPHCGAPIGQSEDQVPSAVAEDTDDEQFGAYYDDEAGFEYDDDGYVDPPPLSPRRKQSKSTNIKHSSNHKEQSSGKLPLIIVGCFLGVGLVGGGVYGVIAMVGQLADMAGIGKPSFTMPETKNEFAKLLEGTWESEVLESINIDDSVSKKQDREVFIYNADKYSHGERVGYQKRFEPDRWSGDGTDMQTWSWAVFSFDPVAQEAEISMSRYSKMLKQSVSFDMEITMVSEAEFHVTKFLGEGKLGKVVYRKKDEDEQVIRLRRVTAKLKDRCFVGGELRWDEEKPATSGMDIDLPVIHVELSKKTDAELNDLKEDLNELPELRILELYDGQITDGGLAHLKDLTNLTQLSLGQNEQITDAGLVHLKRLTNLTYLGLSGNTWVTDVGLIYLKRLTKLERLDLRNMYNKAGNYTYHITPNTVKAFKTALPKCEVYYDKR